MAIDLYKPELAKRKMIFELAHTQLAQLMNDLKGMGPEFRANMLKLDEALEEYSIEISTRLPCGALLLMLLSGIGLLVYWF